MKSKITAELIRLNAREFHGFEVSEVRAGELARDLNRINDAAIAIEQEGDFNDEPGRFNWTLAQLQSAKPRR